MKAAEMMLWMDFAVAGLLMWGAVTGYQRGYRRSFYRLGGQLCAILTALWGRKDLKCFGARHGVLEKVIETMVYKRLAIPVSGSLDESVCFPDLPGVLWEALTKGSSLAAGGGPGNPAVLLVQLLGYTVAFLTGLFLWWGFFYLCGSVLPGKDGGRSSMVSRWGGALIGLIGMVCSAAITIGTAVPLAWLCRVPSGLMQLENTVLAGWMWKIYAGLEIWQ